MDRRLTGHSGGACLGPLGPRKGISQFSQFFAAQGERGDAYGDAASLPGANPLFLAARALCTRWIDPVPGQFRSFRCSFLSVRSRYNGPIESSAFRLPRRFHPEPCFPNIFHRRRIPAKRRVWGTRSKGGLFPQPAAEGRS
jgi:hypothetical protein